MSNLLVREEGRRTILNLKDQGIENGVILGKYTYLGIRSKLDMHFHKDIMEIVYCDTGLQIYQVNGQQFQIKGGDVFITFPNEPHSTANYPEEKGSIYWLQVEIPQDKNHFLGNSHQNSFCLIDALLNLQKRHFKGSEKIKTTLEEIFFLYRKHLTPYSKLVISHKLTSILLTVIEDSSILESTRNCDERVEKAINYIEENLDSDLSISILADHHHLSESHFKRWFKKEVGITPMDYIQRKRIEQAKQDLVYKRELSITDIAFQLKFSSSQYFSTVFKKYAGISPFEYREKSLLVK